MNKLQLIALFSLLASAIAAPVNEVVGTQDQVPGQPQGQVPGQGTQGQVPGQGTQGQTQGHVPGQASGHVPGQGNTHIDSTDSPYYVIDDAMATVYYDLTGQDQCGNTFGVNWSAESTTKPGSIGTACEDKRGYNLAELNMATPIAFNNLFIDNDLINWCGRIVKIYKQNGELYELPSGPFFIWDGCQNCNKSTIVDLSSDAIIGLQDQAGTGSLAGCDNPQHLRVEVLNDYYWKLGEAGIVNENPAPDDRGTGTWEGGIPASVTTKGVPVDWNNLPTGYIPVSTPVVFGPPITSTPGSPEATGATEAVRPSNPVVPGSVPSGSHSSASGGSSSLVSSASATAAATSLGLPNSITQATSAVSSVSAAVQSLPPSGTTVPAVGVTSLPSVSSVPSTTATTATANVVQPVAQPVNGTAGGSESAWVPNGEEANCQSGTYQCNGNELRVCDNIGNNKIGWRPSTQCPNKCEINATEITCH